MDFGWKMAWKLSWRWTTWPTMFGIPRMDILRSRLIPPFAYDYSTLSVNFNFGDSETSVSRWEEVLFLVLFWVPFWSPNSCPRVAPQIVKKNENFVIYD